jgi:hypothetical protein
MGRVERGRARRGGSWGEQTWLAQVDRSEWSYPSNQSVFWGTRLVLRRSALERLADGLKEVSDG